jgi:hypothetical protein
MTSLDSTERSCAEKKQRSAITVICSDGVRIRVDLNLFPSEMLHAARNFADCYEMEIPYGSAAFLRYYESYLPPLPDYFQTAKKPRAPVDLRNYQCAILNGQKQTHTFSFVYRDTSFIADIIINFPTSVFGKDLIITKKIVDASCQIGGTNRPIRFIESYDVTNAERPCETNLVGNANDELTDQHLLGKTCAYKAINSEKFRKILDDYHLP